MSELFFWEGKCSKFLILGPREKKIPLVSGNADDEKNSHLDGHEFISSINLIEFFFFFNLHLKNYSNSSFLCWKRKRPTFYCSKRKKREFLRINSLVKNRLNGGFYWRISLDFLQILFTKTIFSFSFSSWILLFFSFLL